MVDTCKHYNKPSGPIKGGNFFTSWATQFLQNDSAPRIAWNSFTYRQVNTVNEFLSRCNQRTRKPLDSSTAHTGRQFEKWPLEGQKKDLRVRLTTDDDNYNQSMQQPFKNRPSASSGVSNCGGLMKDGSPYSPQKILLLNISDYEF